MFVLAALLVSAQPIAEPQSSAPAATDAPAQKQVKPRKICKADDLISGSRMAKRLCLTEEEWAQRRTGMSESARSGYSGKAAESH